MKKKIENYIQKWEARCYFSGLPEEAPIEIEHLVPDYKKIVRCILNNDVQLKGIGYSRANCELYMQIKKSELIRNGKIKSDKYTQLKLIL